MKFNYNDGGRLAAGYKGSAGDCVTRAIAIVTGKPYQEVYDELQNRIKIFAETSRCRAAKRAARGKGARGSTPRNGVSKKVYDPYLKELGLVWQPTMFIGSGCKVHLKAEELPKGKLIVNVSKHLTTVIDGVINDTYNPQRGGGSFIKTENGITTRGTTPERCVYGYYCYPQPQNQNQ